MGCLRPTTAPAQRRRRSPVTRCHRQEQIAEAANEPAIFVMLVERT
jgi:hypothetical protein